MKMKNNKGFTLAELLIVMAIIVVLAAIAIPTFAKQLETSRESSDVENIRAAAASAFSECYTTYVTDDQVQAGDVYYSTIYQVKFNQHEADFQYMTPMIEVGTSNDPDSDVSGLVIVRKTPENLVPAGTDGVVTALPGNAYLQFQFTVSPEGDFYLTDIFGAAAATAPTVAKAFNATNDTTSTKLEYSLQPTATGGGGGGGGTPGGGGGG